jgi:hypothetical protein
MRDRLWALGLLVGVLSVLGLAEDGRLYVDTRFNRVRDALGRERWFHGEMECIAYGVMSCSAFTSFWMSGLLAVSNPLLHGRLERGIQIATMASDT